MFKFYYCMYYLFLLLYYSILYFSDGVINLLIYEFMNL